MEYPEDYCHERFYGINPAKRYVSMGYQGRSPWLVRPDYDYQNGRGTVVARKDHGCETVVAPIQDLKTLQDVKDSKTKPSSGAVTPSLPDWLPSESWQGFTEMRQRMNAKAWTSRAMTLTLNKLGELRAQGNDPAAVLDQSVMKPA